VIRRQAVFGVALGALVAGCALPGCSAGYSSYPKVEGAAFADPNTTTVQKVIVASVDYMQDRRPIGENFALNLPVGMLPERMDALRSLVEDERAQVLTKERADLPRMHITRVWIRGTRAEVDVLRPVEGVPQMGGQGVHESYTLRLRGGLGRWRVEDARRRSIGSSEPPAPNWRDEAASNPSRAGSEG